MSIPKSGLITDFYQLTMMQGYLRSGLMGKEACFDLFFRSNPFGSGYTLVAGLEDALRFIEGLRFTDSDIDYLKSLAHFDDDFLDYLRGFRFTGEVMAFHEGALAFPLEPVLRVRAPIEQCQLVETALLNIINFQTLIATKAARICLQAGFDNVLEFGFRRAQGMDGALSGSRAGYIGGCAATSNVYAGSVHGIPVKGTHAHSWVTAFDDEITAFRKFVEIYPDNSILLVDTYDTMKSGVPNAIKVGHEMEQKGERLMGIRLDSGDLAFLSIEARKMLDEAGLTDTKIVCSSELDEMIINSLRDQGAKIDVFGVGTKLISADGDSSLSGVFKLAAIKDDAGQWRLRLKKSEGLIKANFPGLKQVWRLFDSSGEMMADLIELEKDKPDFTKGVLGVNPVIESEKKYYDGIGRAEAMLQPYMENGVITATLPSIEKIRILAISELQSLHITTKRLLNPHTYKVSLGPALHGVTAKLRVEC